MDDIDTLIIKYKKSGYLTFDQLYNHFSVNIKSELLDDMILKLNDNQIDLIDEKYSFVYKDQCIYDELAVSKLKNIWYRNEFEFDISSIEHLINIGKEKGFVTFDELSKVLPVTVNSTEQIENIIVIFDQLGIDIVDDEYVKDDEIKLEAEQLGKNYSKIDINSIKHLIDKGKEKGFITFTELNRELPITIESAEQIENLIVIFDQLDIDIVDDDLFEDDEGELEKQQLEEIANNSDIGRAKYLIKTGKKRGFLLFSEIFSMLPVTIYADEQFEEIIVNLNQLGVEILDEKDFSAAQEQIIHYAIAQDFLNIKQEMDLKSLIIKSFDEIYYSISQNTHILSKIEKDIEKACSDDYFRGEIFNINDVARRKIQLDFQKTQKGNIFSRDDNIKLIQFLDKLKDKRNTVSSTHFVRDISNDIKNLKFNEAYILHFEKELKADRYAQSTLLEFNKSIKALHLYRNKLVLSKLNMIIKTLSAKFFLSNCDIINEVVIELYHLANKWIYTSFISFTEYTKKYIHKIVENKINYYSNFCENDKIKNYYLFDYSLINCKHSVQKLLNNLTDIEKKVLLLRFGFYEPIHSFSDIAEIFDYSEQRIRQIENCALTKLNRFKNKTILEELYCVYSTHSSEY